MPLTAILRVAFLAIALNYPWELAQAGLYRGLANGGTPWSHCFVAAVGDAVLVVAIHAFGVALFRRRDWFVRPHLPAYAVTFVSGLSVAVILERMALDAGRWQYLPTMPIVPVVGVGLYPVLQMLILPPLILRVALLHRST